jgi:hypothetical protein
MFGGGSPKEEHVRDGKSADMVPFSEPYVFWENGKARFVQKTTYWLVASGLKGALRHRVAFHHRVLVRNWADQHERPIEADDDEAVCMLFGKLKDNNDGEKEGGPGKIRLQDVPIEAFQSGWLDHVSLDRFTSGPMDGMLFSEAPLYSGPQMTVLLEILQSEQISEIHRKALQRALNDLTQGRLGLGAGGSRGHGFFAGRIDWSDGGDWIRGEK